MTEIIYVLFVLLVLLQAGDVYTTNRILANGGREANPVIAWVMGKLGRYWWLSKVAVMLPIALLVWLSPGYHTLMALLFMVILYLWVVWHNSQQMTAA